MHKFFRLLIFLCILFASRDHLYAQYYYKDILNNETNLRFHQLMKKNKVSKINTESFEATGEPTTDFVFEQQNNASFSQFKTTTSAPLSGKSVMINFYNTAGLLYRTTDSSESIYTQYGIQV